MLDRVNMIEVIASVRVNERAGAAPSGEQYAAEKALLQNESEETLRELFNSLRSAGEKPPATDKDIVWSGSDGTDDELVRAPLQYEELHY